MYAEASFEEGSTRFRYKILATAGKLEKAFLSLDAGDHELKAYALYFMGFFTAKRATSGKLPKDLKNA
jgi:hypothetical protein